MLRYALPVIRVATVPLTSPSTKCVFLANVCVSLFLLKVFLTNVVLDVCLPPLSPFSLCLGRALMSVTAAVAIGPNMTAYLRNSSLNDAIYDLTDKCDPAKFQNAFGVGTDQLQVRCDDKRSLRIAYT